MGANSTQAQGFALFLVAFVLIAVGLATGMNFLYILPGLALLGLSLARFVKCKPWEHIEE